MSLIYKPDGLAGEYSEWACNLYGGCTHACRYCYVPGVPRIPKEVFHASFAPKENVVERFAAEAPRHRGRTVLFCFTSDPYQPEAWASGITQEVLGLCRDHGIRPNILTKAGALASDDFELLAEAGGLFGQSITHRREDTHAEWEPNTDRYRARMEASAEARALGIPTWFSVEPPLEPDDIAALLRELAPAVDTMAVGTWNRRGKPREGIDWPLFGRRVSAVLGDLDCAYRIKSSLVPFMPRGFPVSRGIGEAWAGVLGIGEKPVREAQGTLAL